MFAIIGLGNPGREYENTYHNIGFKVLDLFAKRNCVELNKKKFDGNFSDCFLFNEKVLLLKPLTYMNNSGISVKKLVKKYKLDLNNILVVYDDVDILVGSIRIREKGSAGSHNGMKSIVEELNSSDFPRLRIGIGSNYNNLTNYVLSKINSVHTDEINNALEKAVILIEQFIINKGDINKIH